MNNPLLKNELSLLVAEAPDLESKLECLRIFKNEHFKEIQNKDLSAELSLPEVFRSLSEIADTVLDMALKIAEDETSKIYGYPTFIDNDGNLLRAEFAIVAMGKLGGCEVHYGSDLDLIFLYSRNGETEGRQIITNKEYYAKLVQKMISYLSVHTLRGFAYKVDTQLRPSGNQGPLVSTLDAYADYQRNMAQIWEKQALLKARYVCGDNAFGSTLNEQFHQFIFSTEFPLNLNEEIHHMRMRMEKEIAKENERRLHYKLGIGGLADIEFSVQYLQLKMGKIFENIVARNTLEALEHMGEREILKKNEYETFKSAYLFYRLLEMRMEARFDLKGGYLDPTSDLLENLSETMGEASQEVLLEKFRMHRQKVRQVYLRVMQVE